MCTHPLATSAAVLLAFALAGCPFVPEPDPGPQSQPCEDALFDVDAACEDDLWEPNELLEEAPDIVLVEQADSEGVACPDEVDVFYVDGDGDNVQLIIEWADCDDVLVLRALDNDGVELPDIERGNLDTDRRQSIVFRDGLTGYVEVTNPNPQQGPVHYAIDYVLWSDEDSI